MISKKLFYSCMLIFFCNASSAVTDPSNSIDPIVFDIDGVKIGDTLPDNFFNQYCHHAIKGNKEVECKKTIELNNIKLSILYFVYNEKLLAISINYPSSEYTALINTYTQIFSEKPHNKKEEPVLLSTGIEYTNKKTSWNTMSGEFVIEKYGTSFQKGIAYILSNEYEEYKAIKKEEINPGVMRKLFGDIFN